jgi:threonine/homoserine/homoserine lactone efflux protein
VSAAWQVDLPLLAAFAWFAWVGSVTPGPNCALALATAANFGARSIGPHMIGVAIGFSTMLGASLLGAHALFIAVPWLTGVLKWAGIGWLAWLGLQLARSRSLSERGSARPTWLNATLIVTIFVTCCMVAPMLWAWLGASLRRWLADGRRLAWFNGLLGLSLVATAGWLALS